MGDQEHKHISSSDKADLSHTDQGGPSLRESYIAALKEQREEKNHFFAHDPYSPIDPSEQKDFEGLNYFEPAPEYQYTLTLQRADPESVVFQTNTGDEQAYHRIGTVEFEVDGEPAELAIYESVEHGDLFLPFRDATSGKASYGAGRYVEPIDLGDDRLLVDFNLAYNPYCAYSPDYSCPLPPIENWLKVPIRAGEKKYKEEVYDMEENE
ncbi:MAG: DUF1684 domain-containing protein [Chloroflexota bacterium]|nr:DUF1684 domain-containing protein [Chloroflexota bacterium]